MSVGCPDDVVEGGIKGIGDRIAGQSSFACEWGQDGCPRGGTGLLRAGILRP